MKTLQEIEQEVGPKLYSQWHTHAEKELAAHPGLWGHSEQRTACIYESIHRQYDLHVRSQKVQEVARDSSGNPLLWEGE